MNSDSHYSIGKTHKVCQDYALNKDFKNRSYVIVSDGCSGSLNTDIGARLLCLNLSNWMGSELCNFNPLHFDPVRDFNYDENINVYKEISYYIKKERKEFGFGISDEAYDATLLSLYVKNNQYSYFCFGDGVIARLHTNGIITATSIEYPSGAPYYLNYELNHKRKTKYLETYGAKRIVREHIITPDSYSNWISDERDDATYPLVSSGNTSGGIIAMAIMTDGVLSFTETTDQKIKQPISLDKILRELMGYKNYTGEFVYRRMHKFEKECKELGWEHNDDLSVAAIYLP